MYAPPSAPGESRHRKMQSDPRKPFVSRPYSIRRWPGRARQPTHPQPPSRESSVERTSPDLAQYRISNSSSPVSPRSPTPTPSFQRSGHQRSASGKAPHVHEASEHSTRHIPQSAPNIDVSSTVLAPHPAGQGQLGASLAIPTQPTFISSAGMGPVHHHDEPPPSPVSATHIPRHYSTHHSHHHHQPSTPHHVEHHRSRSGPPRAASHRYASTFTEPKYGHNGYTTSNLHNGGERSHSQKHRHHQHHPHRAPSPSPGTAASYYRGQDTELGRTPTVSSHRSHVPSPVVPERIATPHPEHRPEKPPPHPPPAATEAYRRPSHRLEPPPSPPRPPHLLTAREIFRSPHRRPLPANYDGRMQTRYVQMLLALDGISPLFNVLSAFFTWILLAGFVLLPGTFASFKNEPTGSPVGAFLTLVNHFSL